jgi:hypothetical protein
MGGLIARKRPDVDRGASGLPSKPEPPERTPGLANPRVPENPGPRHELDLLLDRGE